MSATPPVATAPDASASTPAPALMGASAGLLRVLIAADRLTASVQLGGFGTRNYHLPTAEVIGQLLAKSGVVLNDAVRKTVLDVLAAAGAKLRGAPDESATAPQPTGAPDAPTFVVASGRPAADALDATFAWTPELAAEATNLYTLHLRRQVSAGTVLGSVVPARPAVAGVDVFGKALPAARAAGRELRIGAGTQRAAATTAGTADVVSATADGFALLEHGELRIEPVQVVPGDVDPATGPLEVDRHVHVRGTVLAKAVVHAKGSLTVDGDVEAADISAGGDVAVRGGVFGNQCEGRIRASGAIAARIFKEADVRGGGDLSLEAEILGSRIQIAGRLTGEATIIGGEVQAREGLSVRTVGSDAGVPTAVSCGPEIEALRRIRQIDREMQDLAKAAGQIRQTVQPLLANVKRLLPAQRERATELLCRADELDLQARALAEEREQVLRDSTPRGRPTLVASELIHPGTQLRIGSRQVRVHHPISGPVEIEVRKVNGVQELVATHPRTGTTTMLLSTEVDLDAAPAAATPAGRKEEVHASGKKIGA